MFVLKMRAASTRYVGGWLQSFIAAVRGDIWGYAIVFLYSLLCIVLLALTGRFDLSSHERYLGQWTYLYLFIFPLFSVVLLMMRSLLRYQLQGVRICFRALSSHRTGKFAGGMAMMMGLMLFIGNFTTIKNLFPVMHDGFPFDRVTADVDQWLHFGHAPSELLYRLPGLSLALPFIELNYSLLWSVFCFGGLFFTVATARSPLMRMRYILMFMIVWIVCGNVLAGFFFPPGRFITAPSPGILNDLPTLAHSLPPVRSPVRLRCFSPISGPFMNAAKPVLVQESRPFQVCMWRLRP